MKKFAIVDFEDDQGLETSIVPSEWIQMETGQCYWPDQGDPQRAVIDCLAPRNVNWRLGWQAHPSAVYNAGWHARAAVTLDDGHGCTTWFYFCDENENVTNPLWHIMT